MSFARPTLRELVARAEADFNSNLPGADSRLRRSVLYVLARVHAGAMFGLYGFLDWLFKQLFPDTAEAEQLERHASFWGLSRKPAAKAIGNVLATGTPTSAIPEGTVLRRPDGVEFATTDAAVLDVDGEAVVPVEAVVAANDGNTAADVELSFVAPVAGVDSTAVVDEDGITSGADVESDAALRGRVIARMQQPPAGGATHDYVAWALQQPGVTRAWVRRDWLGPGTVGVLFVYDDRPDIFPTEPEAEALQDFIDLRRPVTAKVHCVAPTPQLLDLTIGINPNTASVQAAVMAELQDLIKRVAEPGITLRRSWVTEAISSAAGEFDHSLVLPAGNVTHLPVEMPVLGNITWQAIA